MVVKSVTLHTESLVSPEFMSLYQCVNAGRAAVCTLVRWKVRVWRSAVVEWECCASDFHAGDWSFHPITHLQLTFAFLLTLTVILTLSSLTCADIGESDGFKTTGISGRIKLCYWT